MKLPDARAVIAAVPADEVMVGFSGGKDSLAVLDLCARSGRFSKIACYYLYLVDGLACIEDHLIAVTKRYGVELHKLPHPTLVGMLKHGVFGQPRKKAQENREWRSTDAENAARVRVGIEWVAVGHKACDSLDRRAMLSTFPDGLSHVSRRAFPVRSWTQNDVWSYVNQRKIPLPVRFAIGTSGRMSGFTLQPEALIQLRKRFPEDYRRVIEMFPDAEAAVFRHERLAS